MPEGDTVRQPGSEPSRPALLWRWWQNLRRQGGMRRPVKLTVSEAAIGSRALGLAEEGREDQGAVADLQAMASSAHDALDHARTSLLQAGPREQRVVDRAIRLLDAALSSRPVEPAPPQLEERLRALEQWQRQTPEQRFRQLAALDPRLAELADQARQTPSGPGPAGYSLTANLRTHRDPHSFAAILRRTYSVIGPLSDHRDDPLLGSNTVVGDTLRYLRDSMLPGRPDQPT